MRLSHRRAKAEHSSTTITDATAKRAIAGTIPSATCNGSHALNSWCWKVCSAPLRKTTKRSGAVRRSRSRLGDGTLADTLRDVLLRTEELVESRIRNRSRATTGGRTQPSTTASHWPRICAVGGNSNLPSASVHDAIRIRASSRGSSPTDDASVCTPLKTREKIFGRGQDARPTLVADAAGDGREVHGVTQRGRRVLQVRQRVIRVMQHRQHAAEIRGQTPPSRLGRREVRRPTGAISGAEPLVDGPELTVHQSDHLGQVALPQRAAAMADRPVGGHEDTGGDRPELCELPLESPALEHLLAERFR